MLYQSARLTIPAAERLLRFRRVTDAKNALIRFLILGLKVNYYLKRLKGKRGVTSNAILEELFQKCQHWKPKV